MREEGNWYGYDPDREERRRYVQHLRRIVQDMRTNKHGNIEKEEDGVLSRIKELKQAPPEEQEEE